MRLHGFGCGAGESRRLTLSALAAAVSVVGFAVVGADEGWGWPWPCLLLRDLSLVGLVGAAAWGTGGVAARWRQGDLEPAEDHLARLAVGLGCLGLGVFALGLVGWLRRPALAALLGAGLLPAGVRLLRGGAIRDLCVRGEGGRAQTAARVGVAVALVAALCGTVAPESFFDALYYRTAFPAHYLRLGRVTVFPHAVHSAMPSHVDLCYVPLLAWGGASTVKLGHFALYAGTLAWVAALARRLWGRAAGGWAALIAASLPGVGAMAGLGAVDLGVTFFTTACVALTVAGLSGGPRRGPLAAAAFLAGVAAGSKYSALLFVVVWSAGVAAALLGRQPRRYGLVAGLGALVLLGGGGWYLRNLLLLGTPVYPALAPPESEAARIAANLRADSAPPGGWLDWPQALVEVLAERRGAGAGGELWPGALLLVAGVVWALGRAGPPRWLAVAVIAAFLAWSRSIVIVRYAYPVLAAGAAVAAGVLVKGFSRPGWRRAAHVLALGVAGLAVVRLALLLDVVHQRPWGYLSGRESTEAFLSRRVRGFEAARWVAAHTPEHGTRLLLLGETKGYYFARDYEPVSAYNLHPLVGWAETAADAAALARRLRELGFTHLVLDPEELARLDRRYGHFAASPEAVGVVRELLTNSPCVWAGSSTKIYSLGP